MTFIHFKVIISLNAKWTEFDSRNLLILNGLLRLLQYSLHLLNRQDLMMKKDQSEAKQLLQSNSINNFLYIHHIVDPSLTSTPLWLLLLTETSPTEHPTEMNQSTDFSKTSSYKAVDKEKMLFLHGLELFIMFLQHMILWMLVFLLLDLPKTLKKQQNLVW